VLAAAGLVEFAVAAELEEFVLAVVEVLLVVQSPR
jgi:hypothetical protein